MIRRIQSRKGPGWSDFYRKGIRLFQARIVSAGSSRISATSRRGRCPRTITLRPETLQNLIYDVTASLIRMGFTHVVFMNNHDPNQLILNHVLQCIRKDFGLVMPSLWPTNMAHSFGQELFADAKRVLIHRNEPSTSLMLALCPEKVRMDLAAESPRDYGKLGEIPYGSSQRLVFRGIKVPLFARVSDVFQTGGYGKPKAASAEIGREILARMAEYTSAFIEEFLKTDNALGK
ncbi:MAG: creatininase family protein [Lachnospiraceae bacterium]|nr:creatininase family protein [Lachnospiraceae bacterium]